MAADVTNPNPNGNPTSNLTPPSLSFASDTHTHTNTHQLSGSNPSPQRIQTSSFAVDPLQTDSFQPDFLLNYVENDLDWIFQDVPEDVDMGFFPSSYPPGPGGIFVDRLVTGLDNDGGMAAPPTTHSTPSSFKSHQTMQNAQDPPAKYKETGPQRESWFLNNNADVDGDGNGEEGGGGGGGEDGVTVPLLNIPDLGGGGDHRGRQARYRPGSFWQLERISETERIRIQQSIRSSIERPLWTAVSMANFPSREKLDHCIDLFFANWRPVSTSNSQSLHFEGTGRLAGLVSFLHVSFSCPLSAEL